MEGDTIPSERCLWWLFDELGTGKGDVCACLSVAGVVRSLGGGGRGDLDLERGKWKVRARRCSFSGGGGNEVCDEVEESVVCVDNVLELAVWLLDTCAPSLELRIFISGLNVGTAPAELSSRLMLTLFSCLRGGLQAIKCKSIERL